MTQRPPVLVVAQAFKGTLTAGEVGRALGRGLARAGLEPDVMEASDGGDGLLEALQPEIVRRSSHTVPDPLGRPVGVEVGWLGENTALVESRLAMGLSLLAPGERRPLETSSRGLGALLAQLSRAGAQRLVVGLGGSATVDGGLGMARAWGWGALDGQGGELPDGGGALADLAQLVPGGGAGASVLGLCDVNNPLVGPRGAAPVYGPQKGATPADVERLARGLERLAACVESVGRRGLALRAGAGAAGGLGFGLLAFAGAELTAGAQWVLERRQFAERLERARAVVVAEAAFDRTSLAGKLTGVVLGRAQRVGRPILLVAPTARDLPSGVVLASGPGVWSSEQLARHAERGGRDLARLLGL